MQLSAFRHRSYRLYFTGQFISWIGTWMQMVALQWLVFRLTRSSFDLGLVVFLEQIPVLLFAMLGGLVADRVSRRRILLVTQSTMMTLSLVLAALTGLGLVQFWHVITIACLFGLVNAVDMPSTQAFMFEMVGPKDIQSAVGFNAAMMSATRGIGSAAAGIALAKLGEATCFATNALTFVAIIVSLLAIASPGAAVPRRSAPRDGVGAGLRYVHATPPVRAALLVIAAVMLTSSPSYALMPLFAERAGGGPVELGALMAALGVGNLVGSLALTARRAITHRESLIVVAALAHGLALTGFAFSRSLWLSTTLLAAVGLTAAVAIACSNALIQSIVPDALRGRVMALYITAFIGSVPIGSLIGGASARALGASGPPIIVAAGGVACALAASFYAVRVQSLRAQAADLIRQRVDAASAGAVRG